MAEIAADRECSWIRRLCVLTEGFVRHRRGRRVQTRIFWPIARTTSRSAQVPPSEPPPTARARKIVRCSTGRRSRNFRSLRKTEQRGSGWERVRKARCEERGFGISKHSYARCWER